MATKLDVYKSAARFALDTFHIKDSKQFAAQSLQWFEQEGVPDKQFDFWMQIVTQIRGIMNGHAANPEKVPDFSPKSAPAPEPQAS